MVTTAAYFEKIHCTVWDQKIWLPAVTTTHKMTATKFQGHCYIVCAMFNFKPNCISYQKKQEKLFFYRKMGCLETDPN